MLVWSGALKGSYIYIYKSNPSAVEGSNNRAMGLHTGKVLLSTMYVPYNSLKVDPSPKGSHEKYFYFLMDLKMLSSKDSRIMDGDIGASVQSSCFPS